MTVPSASQPTGADVVIVGAGVVGLACALALLRAGRQVVLLDRDRAGAATSHGNCGTITPSHAAPLVEPGAPWRVLRWMFTPDAPFYLRPRWDPALAGWLLRALRRCNRDDFRRTTAIRAELLLHARQRLEQLVREEGIDCQFRNQGTLHVFRDPSAFEHESAQLPVLQDVGIQTTVLDATQLRALEPALNDSVVGGWLHPQDASLRPDQLVSGLVEAVRSAGGTIREHAEVVALGGAQGARQRLRLADGTMLEARDVIVATASWTPGLLRPLGLKLPVQPGKGYSITFDRPALAPSRPLVLAERRVCVTTWDDGYRLGSTMEFSGYDSSLNRTRLDALRRGAAEYLHEPEGPVVREEWYGWRPMTPDDLPVLGAVPGRRGLWLATGHGMLGVTMSAMTGQLLCELITGREPALNMQPFSPARFLRTT